MSVCVCLCILLCIRPCFGLCIYVKYKYMYVFHTIFVLGFSRDKINRTYRLYMSVRVHTCVCVCMYVYTCTYTQINWLLGLWGLATLKSPGQLVSEGCLPAESTLILGRSVFHPTDWVRPPHVMVSTCFTPSLTNLRVNFL